MKRSAPVSDPKEERYTSRRRQEPVSCAVCRKKKLKCSRTFPCSNCVSRGLRCEPPDAPQWSQDRESDSVGSSNPDNNNVLARVLERLRRLEDVVFSKNDTAARANVVASEEPSANEIHEDAAQNAVFHVLGRTDPESVEPEDEARDLEITGSRLPVNYNNATRFAVTAGAISMLTYDLDLDVPVLTAPSVIEGKLLRNICLPDRKSAHTLFTSYSRSLGSWYHIYHKHAVEALLNTAYNELSLGKIPDLGTVAFLLSIFASGAYFQAFASWPESVFANSSEANRLSVYWKESTLDVLDHVERTSTSSSIEQLQATIIISLLIQNYEGLSKKYWLLHNTSITVAKELSLHVVDHPNRKTENRNVVEDEVKRRLWWYLAGTDWLLGSMPSPQEGTYSINPRHAFVKHPMNVDDAELVPGRDVIDKPMSEPSDMSYFLVRMRGADMCRVFGDLVYPLACGIDNVEYDEIINLENQTSDLTKDMPFYFQLDEESRRRTEPYLSKYPQLATQRYLLSQGLHCHRSRIHRPFLIRGSMNPRYSFSRKACLESVRKSLEIRRLLNTEKRGLVLPIARLNFVVYHVFMAALTLALDLCFNKSTSEAEDQSRRAELRDACSMLQESRTELPAADRFLAPLMKLLRRHKIQLQDPEPQNTYLTPAESTDTPNNPTALANSANVASDGLGHPQNFELPTVWNPAMAPDSDLNFDELWEEFSNMVPGSSVTGWESLFADLDTASMSMGV